MSEETGYTIMNDGTKFKITKSDTTGTCVTTTTDDDNYIKNFVVDALEKKNNTTVATSDYVKESKEGTIEENAKGTTEETTEETAAATAAAEKAKGDVAQYLTVANNINSDDTSLKKLAQDGMNKAENSIKTAQDLITKLPDGESKNKLLEELENEIRILKNAIPKTGGKSKKKNRTKKSKKGGKKKKSQKHKSKKG